MRIALTGTTGFLGCQLASALAARSHTVIGLQRRSLPVAGIRSCLVNFHDHAALSGALRDADVLVHAAAKVHNIGPWSSFAADTVDLTRQVLAAAQAAGIPRIIHISTVGVYGFPNRPDHPPVREDDPPNPIHRWNYYSRAKAEAEQLVRRSAIPGAILRPTWLYGIGPDTILQRIVAALRAGRYRWIGDAQNRLSLLHLSDALDAIIRVIENRSTTSRIYNIAADELAPTQHEFITTLCGQLNLTLPTSRLSYRQAYRLGFFCECLAHATAFRIQPPLSRLSVHLLGGPRRFSSERLRQELGWTPRVCFADGIREALAS